MIIGTLVDYVDQPKKNENNLKEYWTQLTQEWEKQRELASQLDFSFFPTLNIFPETLAFPLIN